MTVEMVTAKPTWGSVLLCPWVLFSALYTHYGQFLQELPPPGPLHSIRLISLGSCGEGELDWGPGEGRMTRLLSLQKRDKNTVILGLGMRKLRVREVKWLSRSPAHLQQSWCQNPRLALGHPLPLYVYSAWAQKGEIQMVFLMLTLVLSGPKK